MICLIIEIFRKCLLFQGSGRKKNNDFDHEMHFGNGSQIMEDDEEEEQDEEEEDEEESEAEESSESSEDDRAMESEDDDGDFEIVSSPRFRCSDFCNWFILLKGGICII